MRIWIWPFSFRTHFLNCHTVIVFWLPNFSDLCFPSCVMGTKMSASKGGYRMKVRCLLQCQDLWAFQEMNQEHQCLGKIILMNRMRFRGYPKFQKHPEAVTAFLLVCLWVCVSGKRGKATVLVTSQSCLALNSVCYILLDFACVAGLSNLVCIFPSCWNEWNCDERG